MEVTTHKVGDANDLASLAKLDENILLEEIKERYRQNKIYTNVGDILLSVNPFKDIGIYGKEYSNKYHNIKRSTEDPHIFAVADHAYQSLMGLGGRDPGNQCVLISGESGAGKTESTKLIIKQLIELCKGNTQLEQQILQVNPLLEAFGNAQTNLNDNSSRFGKYIQLKFNDGHVVGAKISEYLLEKSRVVRQNPGEENFHIFNYMFAAHRDGKYGLGNPSDYRYISNKAGNFNHRLGELFENHEDLVNAMDLVGFTDDEQSDLFAIIASVLHLGNVRIFHKEDDSVDVKPDDIARNTAAELLGIDGSDLVASLTCMVTVTKGEYVRRNYTLEQAEDARDAMSKALYSRVFGWIVNKINCLLAPDLQDPNTPLSEIGILDIFGFEDFNKSGGKNNFEQACINLANEQLQFFFNQHIFKMEQEEYQKEGIDWKEINFVDNKPLLDMFLGKPIGILSLLDEESLFPKGTDQSYVEKLTKAMAKNDNFIKSQQTNKAAFGIKHYAGNVTYDVCEWLEKNRDTLPPGITEILQSSNNALCKLIFKGQITRTGSLALQGRKSSSRKSRMLKGRGPPVAAQLGDVAKRKMTVGGQFKNSLNILMERMTASAPIFVRCLKPNHDKKPGQFDSKYVLAQLLYTGMLETVEIRRKGFAVRPSFAEFVEKYSILVDLKMQKSKQSCTRILEASKLKGWYIGKTKVFLKYTHIEQLKDLLEHMGKSAVHLQRVARGFVARKEYKRRQEKARREQRELEALAEAAKALNLKMAQQLNTLKEHDDKVATESRKSPSRLPPPVPPSPDSISMKSGMSYLEPIKPPKATASTGTQMEDDSGSDSDILEDDFKPVSSNLNKFGRAGTKKAAVTWFRETQALNVIDTDQNKFAEWFHGIISRRESETLLKDKIVGCFLIRVSESRFGYTLSFKAETRCRHYMIDQLKNGKFIIVGEPKVHRSLQNLVNYCKKNKLSNWDHFLTVPCGQAHGECDYMDLVTENMYQILEDNSSPPAIPARNYSVQKTLQPRRNPVDHTTSATQPPKNVTAKPTERRPLPKLPEDAYHQLMKDGKDADYYHKYKSLETADASKKNKFTKK